MEKRLYKVMIDEKCCRKIEQGPKSSMNTVWKKFNKYAKSKGFTVRVEDKKYLGYLAWSNGTEIMELVAAN